MFVYLSVYICVFVFFCMCLCVNDDHVWRWGCSNEPGLMIIGGPGVPGRGSPSHGRGFGRKIWIASLFRSDQPGNCENIFLDFSCENENNEFIFILFFCWTHLGANTSPGHSFFSTFSFWAYYSLDQNVPFFLHPSSQIKCFPSS